MAVNLAVDREGVHSFGSATASHPESEPDLANNCVVSLALAAAQTRHPTWQGPDDEFNEIESSLSTLRRKITLLRTDGLVRIYRASTFFRSFFSVYFWKLD